MKYMQDYFIVCSLIYYLNTIIQWSTNNGGNKEQQVNLQRSLTKNTADKLTKTEWSTLLAAGAGKHHM
jgi:hypothetical protein